MSERKEFKHERRVNVNIDIGADSIEEAKRFLRSLLFDMERIPEDEPWHSTSGGYSSGGIVKITVDKEMTGDRYRELLEEWRQAK